MEEKLKYRQVINCLTFQKNAFYRSYFDMKGSFAKTDDSLSSVVFLCTDEILN